jgi:hypothetical protein
MKKFLLAMSTTLVLCLSSISSADDCSSARQTAMDVFKDLGEALNRVGSGETRSRAYLVRHIESARRSLAGVRVHCRSNADFLRAADLDEEFLDRMEVHLELQPSSVPDH